jgi:hypothetical protein
MKAQSCYNPQQYDNNSSGQQTIDSNSYSFISPTNDSLNNSNEWTQQTIGRTKNLRRSKRYALLNYWCAERVVFKRDSNGIDKVVAIDGGLGGQ